MRFPLAALFFIIAGFIFFCFWAFSSWLLGTTADALTPTAPAESLSIITLLPTAFGIICVVFFIFGILLVFIMDALADEPESFYQQRRYR